MGQNATCKESKRKNFGDVLAHHHGVVTLEGVRVAACKYFYKYYTAFVLAVAYVCVSWIVQAHLQISY